MFNGGPPEYDIPTPADLWPVAVYVVTACAVVAIAVALRWRRHRKP